MRAWEYERQMRDCQMPRQFEDENEKLWEAETEPVYEQLDAATKVYWGSQVPG